MIKRKDGSYSKRGLWDNIRANKGSGKAPTKEMLEQERKIKNKNKMGGLKKKKKGGFPDNNKDGKITQADIFLQKKKTGTIAKHGGVHKKKKKSTMKSLIVNSVNTVKGPLKRKQKAKKMMGGGMKKMMYKSGGFIEPPIANIDDI